MRIVLVSYKVFQYFNKLLTYLTRFSLETCDARAAVVVDSVNARAAVLTGMRQAVVDICNDARVVELHLRVHTITMSIIGSIVKLVIQYQRCFIIINHTHCRWKECHRYRYYLCQILYSKFLSIRLKFCILNSTFLYCN